MIKIGLISDTHNYLDPQVFEYFEDCDEIWHAGDFGTLSIAQELQKIAPVVGVYGNIDGEDIRQVYPLHQRFEREGLKVWMTHIGGIPGRYCLPIRQEMETNPPELFVCGHSHILRISRDQDLNKMLYMNPGAAGKQGFQSQRTVIRFQIIEGKLHNVEVINLDVEQEAAE
ncbi:MAG: metallophosphoesterase family protein [Gracilimonas sp.]|uniref:metallophosphoesterase family protein n=1 Tax=Gracilimonas TaxID=649462 RepID=UPI001B09EDA3|nr:metallophosphoesterase family protein [Gracilimonas sp.]MBO6586533.1 metallophosphoesterase family protein [Gracilimonas sp.]MBO6615190.1 metallophosphoesterase family protein [Gracilimonas sp.]